MGSDEEVGAADTGDLTVGGRFADVRGVYYSGGTGGTSIRVGEVGHVPTYW